MKWFALFSQTGSEIYEVSKKLGRFPDRIITNKPIGDISKVHEELKAEFKGTWVFIPKKPNAIDYANAFGVSLGAVDSIVTLHGFLRIIPEIICTSFEMYNGHPGDIVTHPELKGFNPQEKAFNLKLARSGSVIHKVTAGVDEGEIVMSKGIPIADRPLDEVYRRLHSNSVELWYIFLKEKLA